MRERLLRWWRPALAGIVVLTALTAPWWGTAVLGRLEFFRVRRVVVEGARYLPPQEVLARLDVDTTMSIWDELAPVEARVAEHLQVAAVEIDRRLPGTLVVRVTENLPVALVPSGGKLRAYDAVGRELPIDPVARDLDLPIVHRLDSGVLRLLETMRVERPAVFARLSDVRVLGKGELRLEFPGLPIRARTDLAMSRFTELDAVERDLLRRQARVAEIDLRFRDQVIARVQ